MAREVAAHADQTIMTVLGPVSAEELGPVLPHEHLLIDTRCYWQPPVEASRRRIAEGPVEITNLGFLRRNLFFVRDNLLLDDVELAIAEAMEFRTLGGGAMVDLSLPDIGRDPTALRAIAHATGLHIVMGCGHYVHLAHPASLRDESVESIVERLVNEIEHGAGANRVRPGIIGEIGTWHPLHPDEEKVLRAAARAREATGLALTIHVHIAAREAHELLAILDHEGCDLTRVVLGHLDIAFGHLDTDYEEVLDYHRSLAARGCYIEYDTIGAEVFAPASPVTPPFWTAHDLTRARAIAQLIADGYGDKILISHDVFTKSQLLRYGGFGYGHILRDFQHRLREVGVTDRDVHRLLVDNPKRMLSGGHPEEQGRPSSPRCRTSVHDAPRSA
jgi:phosphotriesterase-related protein